MNRYPALDAMRAVGAGMVVMTHVGFSTGMYSHGWFGPLLAHLDLGVAIFFVLSGFLLARPWLVARAAGAPGPGAGGYLWRRALRILPLYWLVALACLLLDLDGRPLGAREWVSTLTLTQTYAGGVVPQGLAQMWSLCVEASFYLVLPLLVPLVAGRRAEVRRVTVAAALLGGLGLVWVGLVRGLGHPDAAQWLPAYLPWFLGGIVLAALSVSPRWRARMDRSADLPGWWLLALGLFVAACTPLAGPTTLLELPTPAQAVVKTVLYGAIATCLVLPLVFGPADGGAVRRLLARPLPAALGRISYGIFCVHMVVLLGGMHLLGVGDFWPHFWLVLAGTALVSVTLAAAAYVVVERPAMRLRTLGSRAHARAGSSVGSSVGSSIGSAAGPVSVGSAGGSSGASAEVAASTSAASESA